MSILHKIIEQFDTIGKYINKNQQSSDISVIVKEGIKYADIRDDIKSFDLIFFNGGDTTSNMIRFLQARQGSRKMRYLKWRKNKIKIPRDAFSHVGLVVRDDILDDPRLEHGVPYIFESTMSGTLTDGIYNINDEAFLGTQLRNLDDVVKGYDSAPTSRIAVAHFNRDIIENLYITQEEIKSEFTKLFIKYDEIPYDLNPISLISSIFQLFRRIRGKSEKIADSEPWLFCSELVATIYIELGFIPGDVNPKDVVPMDFLGYDIDTKGVPQIIDEPFYIIS